VFVYDAVQRKWYVYGDGGQKGYMSLVLMVILMSWKDYAHTEVS